ncbi:MAG TPA: ABC transporter permease subunit [Thermoanaerobaculia bacterium]|nr:ABC transporter permease subunit [Thermoanaerobaculia bacterium]
MNRALMAVLWKETLDGLRDRRSLLAALAYSFFGPLVLAWALVAIAGQRQPARFDLVLAGEAPPELLSALSAQGIGVTSPLGAEEAEAQVREKKADVALRFGTTFAADLAAQRPARVELLYDSSRRSSAEKVRRLEEVLRRFEQANSRVRLLARGIAPSSVTVLELQRRDFSTPAGRAALVLAMLPMFLLMAAFIAGMNAAIDATAGERERGSLEGLLVHPVSRQVLAWGKWLAAALLAVVGVTLTLLFAQRVLASEKVRALDLAVGLDGGDLLALLTVLLPLALLAPAIQLLIALFSKSFKEAQTYLSLALFVPILPGFFFSFSGRDGAPWMDGVPLLGHQTVITQVLRGDAVGLGTFALLGLTTLAAAVACVAATGFLLGRERVVLGR